jgi:hypothetical protein
VDLPFNPIIVRFKQSSSDDTSISETPFNPIIVRFKPGISGTNDYLMFSFNPIIVRFKQRYGYHIYIVLDARPLELITDLTRLSKEPSKLFLKFAEIVFSDKKADVRHNHSFNSYLLRIPYTLNSKCIARGKYAEVRVVQKFVSPIPIINANLLCEFRLHLADLDVKSKAIAAERRVYENASNKCLQRIPQSYLWIETLLQTPISDYRKHTLELVLAPYLVIINHQPYDKAYSTIKRRALKCNTLRALEPSINNFLDHRIKAAINKSIKNSIPPIRVETIMKKYILHGIMTSHNGKYLVIH